MAITNSERVGKALELLKDGLRPYVERELKATYKDRWVETARPSSRVWTICKLLVPGNVALRLSG